MKKNGFAGIFLFLLVLQILICNYFHVTPYVMLSILPVMVLCIPARISTPVTMIIAFAAGLTVDMLSEGVAGINTLALVPVAFLRLNIVSLVFGEDLLARKEDFSVRKNGIGKVSLALILVQALFLLIYIWADGAGTRPFWFNAARFGASLSAGYVVSLLLIDVLAPDTRK